MLSTLEKQATVILASGHVPGERKLNSKSPRMGDFPDSLSIGLTPSPLKSLVKLWEQS